MTEREGTVGEVIDRRIQVYGDPQETFVLQTYRCV
jgi:hypothetical protein